MAATRATGGALEEALEAELEVMLAEEFHGEVPPSTGDRRAVPSARLPVGAIPLPGVGATRRGARLAQLIDPAVRGIHPSPRRLFALWRAIQRELEAVLQARTPEADQEYVPSAVRATFEAAVRAGDWRNAFLNLNGLNMFEMLRALDALGATSLAALWSQRGRFTSLVNAPRMEYAKSVTDTRVLPPAAPGDLQVTGQVGDAAEFIAEKLAPVARTINPDPVQNIRLILLECNFYGINDRSHIAYVLASAHHESGMGRFMTEFADGTAYEGRRDLGNVHPGDGPRYKGRGFVQITGRRNYTLYSGILSVTRDPDVDLVGIPTRATDPPVAAMIIAHGMGDGTFTGRRLTDFGADPNYDFVQARRIVNGLDRANSIATLARNYRAVMR